ncbi:MAG: hypothetical protein ACJA13_003960 [Paraglaciecola sp.]|jgi:hypothetical protein
MQQKRKSAPLQKYTVSDTTMFTSRSKMIGMMMTLVVILISYPVGANPTTSSDGSSNSPEHVYVYQLGDTILLTGTVSLHHPGEPTQKSRVKVEQRFLASQKKYANKPLLTLRTATTYLDSGEQKISEQDIWQEPDGSLFELTDTYGNELVIGKAYDKGLMFMPAPHGGLDEYQINFYSLYGGPTSGPVTQGRRAITITPVKTITTPNGEYQAYQVNHQESYKYLFTFAGNKRRSYVDIERIMWVSPSQGLIKKIEVRRNYSHSGALKYETRWELDTYKMKLLAQPDLLKIRLIGEVQMSI